MEKIED